MHIFVQTISLCLAAAVVATPGYSSDVFKRAPPQASGIQFVCTEFPEVCKNMCWGAFCVPDDTDYLIYDKPSSKIKRARQKAAGCIDGKKPGRNRCSAKRPGGPKGENCDEYPFASSKANGQAAGHSGKENRCSRCVPTAQNSRQGGVISKGYGKNGYCKGKVPCDFTVFFGNPGAAAHCEPGSNGNCNADSAELCSGPINIIQRDLVTRDSLGLDVRAPIANGTFVAGPAMFMTVGGQTLSGPYGGTIGQPVFSYVPINRTLWEQQTEDHVYDPDAGYEQYEYMHDNLKEDVDYLQTVL